VTAEDIGVTFLNINFQDYAHNSFFISFVFKE